MSVGSGSPVRDESFVTPFQAHHVRPHAYLMRILLIVQFFDGPGDPGSDRLYALCRLIADRGHEVIVLTSPVSYKRARKKEHLLASESFASGGSLHVEYVYAFSDIRGSYLRRYWYFATFIASAALKALRLRRPDVIYAISTPLSVGVLGALLAKRWNCPMLFEVTDVWPDAAIAVGALRSRLVISMARLAERASYAGSHLIVCLTNGIRENLVAKGIPASKSMVITNGVDLALFRERAQLTDARARWRAECGATDQFVCMYMGAHGTYNALHTIIDAAERLASDERICFVLVGEGDVKQELQARVTASALSNVRFLSLHPRHETPGVLSAADCFLLPILRGGFYDLNLPNKFFDYLASGAPILVSGSCEAGRIVESVGAGRVLPPEDGEALAQAIVRLVETLSSERERMGSLGRAVAVQRFTRDVIFKPLVQVIEDAAHRSHDSVEHIK